MIYEENFPAANLLGREASPYLLQHADNPVHWRPWGPEAFHEARVRDVPVLLSVGYAACHWCHVMAHESFENPAVAAVMNRLFVSVKVDREERPEVDQIYMAALHALGEQGGWPLTMFLTPDGAPFWGGTYFPPEPRYGRAGFVQVLEAVADAYRNRAEAVRQNGVGLLATLSEGPRQSTAALGPAFLEAAAKTLAGVTDPIHGGLKGAPKFPNAAMLELLWRDGRRPEVRGGRDAVLTALERMSNGGIYDHVGGGFARYSVDHRWLVPHFEKMLYDNAQLIGLLTLAFLDTGERGFRRRVEETVGWLMREMITEDGAFAASVDADSEGEEGRFYLWKPGEVDAALGYQDGAVFANAYDISPQGNFEGRSIPNRLIAGFPSATEEDRLVTLRDRLRVARDARPAPARDDKVLADWNGLTIAALADAGRALGEDEWIAAAERAFGRIVDLLGDGERLGHSARAGKRTFPGLSTDYGAMIRAAIALAEATEDDSFLSSARRWLAALDAHHWIEDRGAYALAADDARDLPLRLAGAVDEATPSGNALAAEANVRLWLITGDDRLRARADRVFATFGGEAAANVFGHAALLNAFDTRLHGLQVVVVSGRGVRSDDNDPLIGVVRRTLEPGRVVIFADTTRLPPGHPAHGKGPAGGRTTVYLCRGTECSLPITEPDLLRRALR